MFNGEEVQQESQSIRVQRRRPGPKESRAIEKALRRNKTSIKLGKTLSSYVKDREKSVQNSRVKRKGVAEDVEYILPLKIF